MERAGSIGLGLAIAALLAACGGGGQENPREAKFKAIGKANKAITEELKQGAPSLDTIKTNTTRLAALSTELPSWFPAGSGPGSGIETEARAAIWEKPEEFRQAAARFKAAADALNAAAASGDLARIRAAAPEAGASCKGCHDKFRDKK